MSPQFKPNRSTPRRTLLRWMGLGVLGVPFIGCGSAGSTRDEDVDRVRYIEPDGSAQHQPCPPSSNGVQGQADNVAAPSEPRDHASPVTDALPPQPIIKPPRIPRNGVIGLIAPAGVVRSATRVRRIARRFEARGLRVRLGRHIYKEHGYLAGTDAQRADDVMRMFQDRNVDAILAIRGGWGCARILPLLDYDVIRANPKPLVGYSDVASLLLAIYRRAGLITFHGPVGISTWKGETARSFERVLFQGRRLVLANLDRRRQARPRAVRRGVAEGPLLGGNLSVIAAMAGTGYLPDTRGHVVFFEEVREEAYRIDRLLVQLEQAGWLSSAAGLVFGQCRRCSADSDGNVSAHRVITQHLARHRAPSWTNAPIGHVSPVYTIPIGVPARSDASAGMLETLTSAVQ